MDSTSRELIPVPAEDKFEGLRGIQRQKHEAALTNLITGKTPKEVVYQRPVRGGASVDYIPGWWFIEQLNSLFGYLWDFEVISEFVGQKQVWVKGRLTVKSPDGTSVSKTAYGGSDIKLYKEDGPKAGQVIDIGDDLKAAATDALKKAATLLGLAADIYGKREVIEQTGPGKTQLGALYKVGEQKGMDREAVNDLCKKKYGKLPNEIETVLVLGLIGELRRGEGVVK